MAFRKRIRETEQVKFEAIGKTGVFLARVNADAEEVMRLLKRYGLLPLIGENMRNPSEKEVAKALSIVSIPEVLRKLKGTRFPLGGIGTDLIGFNTFNEQGLTKGKGDIEKTVYVWKGPLPLSLNVRTDYGASFDERRFDLYALDVPRLVARVAVGVRASHEVSAPKIEATQARRH